MEKEEQFMIALKFIKNIIINDNINNICFNNITIEGDIIKVIITINEENRYYYIDKKKKNKFCWKYINYVHDF